MGGFSAPPNWFAHQSYHNWYDETAAARTGFDYTSLHNSRANNDFNQFLTALGYEQERIQTKAFQDELLYLLKIKDLEWSIFQEEVRKGQATFIANYYTNRVTAELGNLREIVNEP